MSKDPTNLPSLSLSLDHDSNNLSDLERQALSMNHSGERYFEMGMVSSFIDQDRLQKAIDAWSGFESYA